MEEDECKVNGLRPSPERRGSDWDHTALLDKTKEFFQTCDVEGKGFIHRTDMRRLHRELPLSAEELEDVFDSLDTDHTGHLTLAAFSSRFSQFLHGRRISVTDELNQGLVPVSKAKEALYQSQWEARLSGMEDEEEEGHFTMLLESLGASNDSERIQLHSQDLEHQLLSKERELDHLFQKQKRLELQCHELNNEKQESHVENVKLKMTNDELSRALENTSQELTLAQEQLAMLQEQAAQLQWEKEMEMYRVTEGLQREKQSLMKQLDLLREMNKHLKDECDVCCGVPRNSLRRKQKQRADLDDLFDDSSKPAKSEDETPPTSSTTTASASKCQRPSVKRVSGLANGNASGAQPELHEVKPKTRKNSGKTTMTVKNRDRSKKVETGRKVEEEEEVVDAPPDGWPLHRIISIEEDHLPHLLQGGPQILPHQLSEEEDEVDEEDALSENEPVAVKATDVPVTPPSRLTPSTTEAPSPSKKSHLHRVKKTPMSSRGQPVGKETQQEAKERALFAPDRLFKVVLVGNSSVGKTSLLRSFCEGRFHPSTTATVGIDYSVKTLTLGNMQVAMQLWDTAGQERYRSITKQFFRKADGVVVMYDVTVDESFKAIRPWLSSVQEAAGEGIHILLLGNKMDMEREREVSFRDAQQLSFEHKVMFFEVSAYTGKNVTESLTQLARVLMEAEDKERETTVTLGAQPVKKKACCK
uniref:EF-hand calcium binding domain 4Bb n=1 Tax=Nothobranchius furzeri TaxID=105023 RepID=A0A1A8B3X2_NOTFU